MIKNYLLLAFRNLKKQKAFTLINIAGLTVGISCCLMIFVFVLFEFSHDNFHKNGNDIYRVMRIGKINDASEGIPYLAPPYAAALKNDYPDAIKRAVRVMPSNGLVSFNNTSFNEKKLYITDPDFFELFSFPLVKGNAATALKEPGSIVLTETTAKKYFGNEDPIGRTVMMDKELPLKVTAIARDVPANSHLSFDLVMPIANYTNQPWFSGWNNNSLFVYVQLNPSVDQAQLQTQFPAFMDKYLSDLPTHSVNKVGLALRPLREIYFEPSAPWDNVRHGNKKIVYIFLCIAVLILIIACINFMNLSTARATDRSREVGLRKVLGAMRSSLVTQFMGESVLLALLSSVFAVILLKFLMPTYNFFLGYTLPSAWGSPYLYAFLAAIIILVGILAGSYPALMMASFSPIDSLKGKLRLGKGGAIFRKALVVFQFSISVLLIIGVIIIINQMNFIRNKDLGYNKEQQLLIKLDNSDLDKQQKNFKQQVAALPGVEQVSIMSGEPGGFHDNFNFEVAGSNEAKWMFRTVFADFEYLQTFGLKLIAGRNFSASLPTDSTGAAIISRMTANKLGYTPEAALGKSIRNMSRDSLPRRIIGVVEDFNFLSLKEPMAPLVIAPNPDRRVIAVKLKAGDQKSTLASIKNIYSKIAPVYPFEYDFMDQQFAEQYKTDIRQQYILTVFSTVAIFIACLGLFGLASYTAVKRTKEIGVRKVLGSSIQNIVVLLSKDLLKPVLLGTLVAIPIGYMAMHSWLEGFAYRTPLHWWIFGSAAVLAILIALLTVSFQAVKAALANPVKSLRSE